MWCDLRGDSVGQGFLLSVARATEWGLLGERVTKRGMRGRSPNGLAYKLEGCSFLGLFRAMPSIGYNITLCENT